MEVLASDSGCVESSGKTDLAWDFVFIFRLWMRLDAAGLDLSSGGGDRSD